MKTERAAIETVAEAWASIDGKSVAFAYCKAHPDAEDARRMGYYGCYLSDSEELIRRVERRGFMLVRCK